MADLDSDVRTSAEDVKEIIDTSLTDSQIKAFINTANNLVEQYLAGSSLASCILEDIEKFLTAHLIHLRDPRVEKESFGDVSQTYQGETGMGLEATQYGQMVTALDQTGKLSSIDDVKQSVEINVFSEADL